MGAVVESRRMLVVQVGASHFAFPAERVCTVLDCTQLRALPKLGRALGVVEVGSRLVPVVALGAAASVERGFAPRARIVVLETAGPSAPVRVGYIVDAAELHGAASAEPRTPADDRVVLADGRSLPRLDDVLEVA